MVAFWEILGEQYCKDNGLQYIAKNSNIDEQKQLHDDALLVINLDGSGSMGPRYYDRKAGDYYEVVEGAK